MSEASKNHKIHIVTNGLREVQRPRIDLAGLNGIASSITVSDEIGYAKPQRQFFETAFHNANYPNKKDSLMLGDNYSSDIEGAYNFGMNSCWYNRLNETNEQKYHTYEITDLSVIKI